MDLKDLKIGDVVKLVSCLGGGEIKTEDNIFYKVGQNYFIKTVTEYYVGELLSATDKEIILIKSAWVADTGRLTEALEKTFESQDKSEIEMVGEILLNREAIVSALKYKHKLPTSQK